MLIYERHIVPSRNLSKSQFQFTQPSFYYTAHFFPYVISAVFQAFTNFATVLGAFMFFTSTPFLFWLFLFFQLFRESFFKPLKSVFESSPSGVDFCSTALLPRLKTAQLRLTRAAVTLVTRCRSRISLTRIRHRSQVCITKGSMFQALIQWRRVKERTNNKQ